ncbi:hypothetical protein V6N11_081844 [Hibiscus sabdariffa]|uniref:Uncharacterized protein n=1 Tax=Hibiscus sabdariffa TaxID=183260 RepID=A0ABR2Q7B5_9ROSI
MRPNNLSAVVADIVDEHGQWRWNLFERFLPYEVLLHIAAFKPPFGVSYDFPGWSADHHQGFSVRSAYGVRKGLLYGPIEPVWTVIAKFKVETDSLDAYPILTESSTACGGSTLVPYILELLSRPWEVRMSHVKRGGNALADCMVKVAPVSDFIVHRYLDAPLDCIRIVEEETARGDAMVLPC